MSAANRPRHIFDDPKPNPDITVSLLDAEFTVAADNRKFDPSGRSLMQFGAV
jgi:hypothetical protein